MLHKRKSWGVRKPKGSWKIGKGSVREREGFPRRTTGTGRCPREERGVFLHHAAVPC